MLREKIPSFSFTGHREAKLDRESTAYHLRRNAESCRSSRVCGKVRVKLETVCLDRLELCFLDDYVVLVMFCECGGVACFGLQLSSG